MAKIICTVTNDLNYDQRMIRICNSLSKAGHEVWLIGRIKPNSPPLQEQHFKQKRLQCKFNSGKLFYIEYNIRLLFFIAGQQYDSLCAIDLDTIAPMFFWSRLRKKPLIYDAHEYYTESPEIVDRPLIKAIWTGLAKFVIPRLKYCYTVGPRLAQVFTERYKVPFEVIRNVPLREKTNTQEPTNLPEIHADDFILLYQGALNEGRGIETAIEALRLLPDQVKLWLVGEGDLSDFLRKLSQEKELTERVHFLGYRLPDELKAITPKADLGLNLLENKGLNYYYSLANKCFDYMQAGIPAIHMNFPEYKAIQDQYPAFVLLDKLEANQLANHILNIMEDQPGYQSMVQACQIAAEEFIWENEEKKLIQFYQHIFPG